MNQVIKLENRYNIPTDLPVISSANVFLIKLSENNIDDFPHKDLNIINNGNNYIINIGGEDMFQVQNMHNLLNFLNRYLQELKNNNKLDSFKIVKSDLHATEKELTIMTINKELGNLAQNILDRQYEELEEAKSRSSNALKINTLIDFYKDIIDQRVFRNKKGAKGEKKEHWKLVEQSAKQEIGLLKQLKTTNQLAAQSTATNKDNLQVTNREDTFIEISEKLDQLILKAQSTNAEILKLETGDANIISLYNIDLKNIDKKDAIKLSKTLNGYKKRQSKLLKIMIEVNQEKMQAQDIDGLIQYLDNISKGKQATFEPQFQNQLNNFNKTIQANENLIGQGGSNSTNAVNQYNSTNIESQRTPGRLSDQEIQNLSPEDRKTYDSRLDATSKGGLYGLTDYLTEGIQDQSPRGQQFYKSFGNIALAAGGVFLGLKFVKSAWRIITGKAAKDENDNSWAWILGTSGLLLATAGRPQDLFKGGYASERLAKTIQRLGIGKKDNNSSNREILSPMIGSAALFGGQTIGNIKNILEQNGDGENKTIRIQEDQYTNIINQLNTILENPDAPSEQKEKARSQKAFLEEIGKKDENNIVDTILSGIGLDRETLSDSSNEKVNFDDKFKENFERILNLTSYMQKNKIENMNDTETDAVKKYISEGKSDLIDIFKKRSELIRNREETITNSEITLSLTQDQLANIDEDEFYKLVEEEKAKLYKVTKKGGGEVIEAEEDEKIEPLDNVIIEQVKKYLEEQKGNLIKSIETENPYLKIYFEPKYASVKPGDPYLLNIHNIISGSGIDTKIDDSKMKSELNLQEEKYKKDIENGKIANKVVGEIKRQRFKISDLFPETDSIYYRKYFDSFSKKTIVFDQHYTLIKSGEPGSKYTTILLTLDNIGLNKSYNKNIEINIKDIINNDNQFDETKFKNELKTIITKIIKDNLTPKE